MKILIADDELNLRTMLAAHLKHAGYEVTAVSDGEEAVKAASEDTFDVMVFDIMMPNKNTYSGDPQHSKRRCGRPYHRT